MGRKSDGGKPMPRLVYVVVVACTFALVLLQLTGWSAQHSLASNCGTSSHTAGDALQSQVLLPTRPQAPAIQQLDTGTSTPTTSSSSALEEAAQNASAGPPFRLPKLIHQTVINKSRLSCEEKNVIDSWKRLNPGYTHRLWDDQDIREFMLQFYPELVPVPFDEFVKGTERSDLWRVLVLHKYGGVYADMDVECLKPVDEWNADHKHDAAVLLGLENYVAKRTPHKLHVTNWAMAAMPGHPLLARMPGVVVREVQKQYFALARGQKHLTGKLYEEGILERTGPAALTTAMYEYFDSFGVDLNKFTEDDVKSESGVIAGQVRVLPVVSLSTGWEVAEARARGTRYTCADVAAAKPQALVCHMFWGSWRTTWKTYKPILTYENC